MRARATRRYLIAHPTCVRAARASTYLPAYLRACFFVRCLPARLGTRVPTLEIRLALLPARWHLHARANADEDDEAVVPVGDCKSVNSHADFNSRRASRRRSPVISRVSGRFRRC
jgi:hypothetical protein